MKKIKIILLMLTFIFFNILTGNIAYTAGVKSESNSQDDNNNERSGYIAVYPPFNERIGWNDILMPKIKDIDYAPTAECAVSIADSVGYALYEDFDGTQYDVFVKFYKSINKWVIQYLPDKLSKEEIKSVEDGSLGRMDGRFSGPTVLVYKTTGEVTVYYELTYHGKLRDYNNQN